MKKSLPRRTTIRSTLCVTLGLALLVTASPVLAADPEPRSADAWSWEVQVDGITVIAGTRLLASKHQPYPFVPIQISISNQGGSTVPIARGDFEVRDPEGRTYGLAALSEVRSHEGLISRDRDRTSFFEFEGLDVTGGKQVREHIFPAVGELGLDRINLLPGQRFLDVLYFDLSEADAPPKLDLVIEGLIDAPAIRIPLDIGPSEAAKSD